MATAFSLKKFSSAPLLARSQAISKGLPARAIRELVDDPAITIADISRVVAPRRTIDRRLKDDSPLTHEEGDRLARFISILDLAVEIFGNRAEAMDWLENPRQAFDDKTPLDLIRDIAGFNAVEEHLLRIKHGFFA